MAKIETNAELNKASSNKWIFSIREADDLRASGWIAAQRNTERRMIKFSFQLRAAKLAARLLLSGACCLVKAHPEGRSFCDANRKGETENEGEEREREREKE